jgi:AbrB family looped-hinge helix DNA binding protein
MATTVSIDKAGRLVLPKPIRDKLGLGAGDCLAIESEGDEITLRPVRSTPTMIKKQGIWVHNGELPSDFDIVEFINQQREKRALEFLK